MSPRLDLVIENADIVTMDARRPRASRVGVLFGRVVGLDEELDGFTAEQRIDAGGACVVPGFIDAHTHLQLRGQWLNTVDIGGCTSVENALATIAAAADGGSADGATADEWIEVGGYDHNVLGRHLTAGELDSAARGRRVWARHVSCHASVVSTAVLDAVPDKQVLADPKIADGLLEELDQNVVRDQRLPYSVADLGSFIAAAADEAKRQGVTTCVEAGNGGEVGSLGAVDGAAYIAMLESGMLPLRVQLMPSIDVLHGMETHRDDGFDRGIDLGLRNGFGSDWLGIAGQKIVLDGGMQVSTARMSEPFEGSDHVGTWRQDPDYMLHAAVDGHRAGWQLAVHAIGDRAVDLAIEAFESAQTGYPRRDARHRIEHGGAIRPDQLKRLADVGATVVTQPAFLYHFGDQYTEKLGPRRTDWLYRGRSLIDHGIPLVGSTDRPLPGSPLRAIQALVDRTSSLGQVITPDERIGVEEALAAFTVNGAWAIRREDRLGRIAPRYLADFTVLAHNPLTVDISGIADIAVLGTVVDGSLSWV